jgi:hypothetical protein
MGGATRGWSPLGPTAVIHSLPASPASSATALGYDQRGGTVGERASKGMAPADRNLASESAWWSALLIGMEGGGLRPASVTSISGMFYVSPTGVGERGVKQ